MTQMEIKIKNNKMITELYTATNIHPITGELFYKGSCAPQRVKREGKKLMENFNKKLCKN